MKKIYSILFLAFIMTQSASLIYGNEIPTEYIEIEQQEVVEDFYTYIDSRQFVCSVYWENFQLETSHPEYLFIVEADGNQEEPIISIGTKEEFMSFTYPKDAENLLLRLYYKENDVYSLVKEKSIDLVHSEFLKIIEDKGAGLSRIEFAYYSIDENALNILINDNIYNYLIQGQDSISLALESGNNTFEAFFEGEDHIVYRVSGEIYYNTIAPSIEINEQVYGKKFEADEIIISGSIKNGSELTINEEEVMLNEEGEFAFPISLKQGENRITFLAKSDAGVTSFKSMIIKKEEQKQRVDSKFSNTEVLAIAVGISIVIIGIILIRLINKRWLKK